MVFIYSNIGKTLAEVHKECGANPGGYSVFILQGEKDYVGKHLDSDVSIGQILKKHPKYADYKVRLENDFYGQTILRVDKGGEQE